MSSEAVAPPDRLGIQTFGLSRRFGRVVAVGDLELRIERGEIYGLVGPDGAGKTTTLRMIAGLTRPDSGEIRVGGNTVHRRATIVDDIGYMPQRFGLYADLTVRENIDFHSELRGLSQQERRTRQDQLLAMTRLSPFRDRRAGQLSGGMKQKLALCCSLLHRPATLILDEPTNGVDPVSRRDFWRLLRGLSREGLTILLSTSHLDEAERCYRVGLLVRGRLIAEGVPEELTGAYSGRCFQVRGADSSALASALQGIDGSHLVSSIRRNLVFLDQVRSPQWLVAGLRRSGLEVEVTSSRPDLEDLFIRLQEEDARRAER